MSYQNYSRAYNISDHTWIYTGGMSNSADYTNDLIQSRKGFVWSKPKNSKLIVLFYVAAGGGGGGGCASPTGTAAGGGGGGAAGAAGIFILPSFMVPENMRILPGTGGGGGIGGTSNGTTVSGGSAGSVGTGTLISYIVGDQTTYSAQMVNAPRTNGGSGGASGSGGSGGNAPSLSLNYGLFGLGYGTGSSDKIMNVQSGYPGSITTSSTANNTFGYSYSFLAGAGGGGVTTAGQAFLGGSITYGSNLSEYSITKTTPNATSGADGYTHFSNFLEAFGNFTDGSRLNDLVRGLKFISGSGGGGNVGGNGGNGGDGSFGCGGGGGGAAQGTNVSGGTGGKGGPGLVIISSIF